jgi:hypothetical protein
LSPEKIGAGATWIKSNWTSRESLGREAFQAGYEEANLEIADATGEKSKNN